MCVGPVVHLGNLYVVTAVLSAPKCIQCPDLAATLGRAAFEVRLAVDRHAACAGIMHVASRFDLNNCSVTTTHNDGTNNHRICPLS